MDRLLSIPEFCTLASTGKTNAYKLINTGKIPAVKLGKKTFIRRSDFDAWVAALPSYEVKNNEGAV